MCGRVFSSHTHTRVHARIFLPAYMHVLCSLFRGFALCVHICLLYKLSLFRKVMVVLLKDLWYHVCHNIGNSNKPNSKPNLVVLTVSLFYVIYYVRCLAGLICYCAALVLAVVFYCFHQHKLSLYDLSKYYTLILKEAKRAKGKNERKSKEMR